MQSGDLAFFLAAVRTGSVGRAAESLGTVQSNVTVRIRRLENEIGALLFRRHARGVSLTAAGERLLPYATQIEQSLADARRSAADPMTPQGPLVLGAMETTVALRLGGLLAAFSARFPAVDLTLRTDTTAGLVEQVLRQELEGAFVCGPVAHPRLIVDGAFPEELVLVCGSGVPSIEALAAAGQAKVFVLRKGCSYRQRLEELLARRGIAVVRIMEYGTIDAILSCVSAGMGMTLLPAAFVEIYAGRYPLTSFRLPSHEARAETVFVRRAQAHTSASMQCFLEMIRRPMLALAAE